MYTCVFVRMFVYVCMYVCVFMYACVCNFPQARVTVVLLIVRVESQDALPHVVVAGANLPILAATNTAVVCSDMVSVMRALAPLLEPAKGLRITRVTHFLHTVTKKLASFTTQQSSQ